ncbi:MAG: Holliday junction resolvase [Candidatus Woesearchaeota archaeon]|jgi:Holliday junction resolvase
MSLKSKGLALERELVHLLQDHGFSAVRVAASGATQTPSTDILAGNTRSVYSFECKSVKGNSRYISKSQIADFLVFSRKFGAQPFIAVRFSRKPWKFMLCEDLHETPGNFGFNRDLVERKGIDLADL